ncbi:MAG: Gx transporter family protein [Bacilli bacterium]|nr:Gx transporter family protein [Bacilli bacterium]
MEEKEKKNFFNVHKIALLGVLTAGAIVIAIAESFIPSFTIPGIKLGLANIVILIILYELGIIEAIIVNLARVLVVGLVRGTFMSMGFIMSLTGALLSLAVMILFYLLIKKFSIVGVSVIGSLFHVIGQIGVAIIYLGTGAVVYYLPIIAISAIITGVIVGLVAKLVIDTGVIRRQKEKYNF